MAFPGLREGWKSAAGDVFTSDGHYTINSQTSVSSFLFNFERKYLNNSEADTDLPKNFKNYRILGGAFFRSGNTLLISNHIRKQKRKAIFFWAIGNSSPKSVSVMELHWNSRERERVCICNADIP